MRAPAPTVAVLDAIRADMVGRRGWLRVEIKCPQCGTKFDWRCMAGSDKKMMISGHCQTAGCLRLMDNFDWDGWANLYNPREFAIHRPVPVKRQSWWLRLKRMLFIWRKKRK